MKKLKLKKTTLTTVITIIAIVIAYFVMNTLNNSGVLSNVMSGLLVRICVWSIMAVSLNLVVGILGELSLGHAGFMYVGAFTGSLFTQITADMISNDLLRFVIGIKKQRQSYVCLSLHFLSYNNNSLSLLKEHCNAEQQKFIIDFRLFWKFDLFLFDLLSFLYI